MNQTEEFTDEQKQYLQGFTAGWGVQQFRAGAPVTGAASAPVSDPATGSGAPTGPDALQYEAQSLFLAEGKKLTPEEAEKRKKHPLDRWDDLEKHAAEAKFPKGADVFMWKYQGLFYVAPAQDSFMARLRFPGGIMNAHQMREVARIAEEFGGGYSHVTTRANLQVREIRPGDTIQTLIALHDAGIVNRGAGADNIRNVTGSPTAGIDLQETIDTRPLAREMHHFILNHREMYGLPRKFNIAFDGGGRISVLEETNDVGFAAVRVGEGKAVPPGVYFRLQLGGITGHQDFARDTGLLLRPEECVPVAAAVVRVFIENGDRTDRKKARLKYVLDRWGMEKYVEETLKHLSFTPLRLPLEECEPRGPLEKHGHIGFHPQRQEGLFYVGVALPVGKLTVEQMRGLASLADRYSGGVIRLTVWQNLLLSDIPEAEVPAVKAALEALGLGWSATSIRAGLIACTGSRGCKFGLADTKGNALEIAEYLEPRVELDQPVNIHLTGCPNSCAQHYIGDIGLVGTKVEAGDNMVDGYHMVVGGGYGAEQEIGREIFRGVPATEAPQVIERMLQAYLNGRTGVEESFADFVKRHSEDELKRIFDGMTAVGV